MPTPLSEDEIALALAGIPEWSRDGAGIIRTLRFPDYLRGIAFVNEVARLAEAAQHHPDIHVGWRKVTLRLITHSTGGLTEKDFALARDINRIPS